MHKDLAVRERLKTGIDNNLNILASLKLFSYALGFSGDWALSLAKSPLQFHVLIFCSVDSYIMLYIALTKQMFLSENNEPLTVPGQVQIYSCRKMETFMLQKSYATIINFVCRSWST